MATVYLHPIGLDAQVWKDVIRQGDIALNFPGFGDTPLEGELTLSRLADFVADHITEPADLVGVSLGSMVAQHTALRHPDAVRSIVLACGGVSSNPAVSHARAAETRRTGMDGMLGSTLERWFTPAALAADSHPGVEYTRKRLLSDDPAVFAAYWDAMAEHDLRESIGTVRAATTVVAGSEDLAVSVDAMSSVAALIDGARFEVVDGPHLLPLENSEGFLNVVKRHLNRLST